MLRSHIWKRKLNRSIRLSVTFLHLSSALNVSFTTCLLIDSDNITITSFFLITKSKCKVQNGRRKVRFIIFVTYDFTVKRHCFTYLNHHVNMKTGTWSIWQKSCHKSSDVKKKKSAKSRTWSYLLWWLLVNKWGAESISFAIRCHSPVVLCFCYSSNIKLEHYSLVNNFVLAT